MGLQQNIPDGESLDSWASSNNLGLLYDPDEGASFSSQRLNVGTNPDWPLRVSMIVPGVTTPALPHNATDTQGSRPQRSGEALELSQDSLEALWPSYK